MQRHLGNEAGRAAMMQLQRTIAQITNATKLGAGVEVVSDCFRKCSNVLTEESLGLTQTRTVGI